MEQTQKRNREIIVNAAAIVLIFAGGAIVCSKSTGWLLSYLVLVLYYFLIYTTMKYCKLLDVLKTISIRDKLISAIFSILLIAIIAGVITQEKYVYYWDYSSYMYYTVNVSNGFGGADFSGVFHSLLYSINHDEYNYLICYIIAIPFKLLKQSYLAFEILICMMFLIPGVYIISTFIYMLCRRYFRHVSYGFIYIIVALFPSFVYVILLGYVDAVGLPLIGLSFYLALKMEDIFDWKYCLLMSCNLVLLMMLRRWYAAFILSFVLFLIVKQLIQLLEMSKKERKSSVAIFIKNYFLVGCVSLVIFLTALNGMLQMLLFNNYKSSYKGWNTSGMVEKCLIWLKYFGLIVLAMAVFAMVTEWLDRKKRKENFWCISAVPGIVVSAVYFWRLADMPEHVYYIFCVQICFCFLIGIHWIADWVEHHESKNKNRVAFVYGITFCFVVCNYLIFLCVFPVSNTAIGLFTGNRYEARIRNDIDSLQNLQEYLGELTEKTENNKVYIAASGHVLNDDILRRLNAPDYALPYTLLPTTHADLVGGFNIDFLDTSIVVVTDPIQEHLLPGSQQVLEYIVNQVQKSDSMLGSKYEFCREFRLGEDVAAKVYKKTGSYTEEDIQKIKEYFDGIYPENADIFADKFDAYLNHTFPRQSGMTKTVYPKDHILCSNYYDGVQIISTGADNLIYGPYEAIQPGAYTVSFIYEYTGDVRDGEQIGYIDINIPSRSSESYDHMQAFAFAGETKVSIQDWVIQEEYPQAEIRFYSYVPGIEIKKVIVTHQ